MGRLARRQSLWKLGTTSGIALEIALGESAEARLLAGEVRDVEFTWKKEEGLARIMDEELTPRRSSMPTSGGSPHG